ncbi:hypothetical protein KFL_000790140 [Klebsormidium nitens]|uniref:Coiled-coil domain-containing protein 137 n=1 Tax=Klebsormidium nitens TaxID=105231 RepID=A0A1Y1HW16_KLENI|nr:hypothetical protein KFL_000790140 [Klebsormidium nitens]|eukprot:GAQ81389.1 hypothetical protein KFL_000790140 [Klebsormidium nitens]
MVSKGKSRRRRESNLKEAKNDQRLPPPPKALKEGQALPAGLRRMMALRDSMKGSVEGSVKHVKRGPDGGLPGLVRPSEAKAKNLLVKKADAKKGPPAGSKRSREQPLTVINTSNGKPEEEEVLTGLAKRRKFLKEKKGKKRKKRSNEEDEAYRNLYKQDKVRFGDVVQAPPKLSSKHVGKVSRMAKDKSAAGKRHWPESLGALASSQERLRQQAVEGYRISRGRTEQPSLVPPISEVSNNDH